MYKHKNLEYHFRDTEDSSITNLDDPYDELLNFTSRGHLNLSNKDINSIDEEEIRKINLIPYRPILLHNMYCEAIDTPRGPILVANVDEFIGQCNEDICNCVIAAFKNIK